MRITNYLLYILIIFLAGCASLNHQKQLSILEESARKYGDAIRWSYFERADNYRRQQQDRVQETDFNELKKIRVTSYEVLSKNLSEQNIKAVQTVEIKYYHISNMIEKTVIDRQEWEYDTNKKQWLIHSSLPHFNLN